MQGYVFSTMRILHSGKFYYSGPRDSRGPDFALQNQFEFQTEFETQFESFELSFTEFTFYIFQFEISI